MNTVKRVTDLEHRIEEKLTILWHELEQWQQDNPSILSGYRRASNSYWKSIASLGYLHNESVNVYSHLVGSVATGIASYVVYKTLGSRYDTASWEDICVFSCFFLGCITCLSTSATYHLLSNHSVEVSKFGNQLDYLGIVFLIWGSFIPSIYYGFEDRTDLIKVYWSMITVIGIMTAYVSISPKFRTPDWRPIRATLFVAMGLSAVFPVLHGLAIFGLSKLMHSISLFWLVTQGLLYIIGATVYAARVPERLSPGTYDIWGHSHQIFHFLVLVAAASHLVGLVKAFDHRHSGPLRSMRVGINVARPFAWALGLALDIWSQVTRGLGSLIGFTILIALVFWLLQ